MRSLTGQTYQDTNRLTEPEQNNVRKENGAKLPRNSRILGSIFKVISVVFSVIVGLLVFRLLLSFFDTNVNSALGGILFDAMTPLVTPFRELFGVMPRSYGSKLDLVTVLAIIVYALIAGLFSILSRRRRIQWQ